MDVLRAPALAAVGEGPEFVVIGHSRRCLRRHLTKTLLSLVSKPEVTLLDAIAGPQQTRHRPSSEARSPTATKGGTRLCGRFPELAMPR